MDMKIFLKQMMALAFLFAVGAPAAAAPTPEELVRSTSDEILAYIKAQAEKGDDDAQAQSKGIAEIVEPIIDFDHFARSVLGKHWRKANDEQREKFTHEFRAFLIRAQTKPLTDYADAEVKIIDTRARNEKNVAVFTELNYQRGKAPLPITYLFRKKKDEWKLINVVVEGLNLIKNFRTSFSEDISKGGLDALIDRLAKSNDKALPE